MRVYPMEIWIELERKLQAIPGTHPSKARFLDRVHFSGKPRRANRQGRLLIPVLLRETAQMSGNVDVLGKYNYLEIWNPRAFHEEARGRAVTDETVTL